MSHKKLALLLTLIVMLGQASVHSTLFAQAEPQSPTQIAESSIQVASVIQRPDIDGDVNAVLKGGQGIQAPQTPDFYTVDMGVDKAPIIIQVQRAGDADDQDASLLLNGTAVLHFHGTLANISAYDRVKAVANRLNGMLVVNAESMHTAKPAFDKVQKLPVIQIGGETLATVDVESAKVAKVSPERLAFLWTNRLRDALGEKALSEKDFAVASASYRGSGRMQSGLASWYGPGFHGHRTASGARFNMYALTAAHRTLPFGTLLRVTNQRTKRSCVVKVIDRGPYAHGRIIDLSKGAAQAIGMSGVAKVTLEVVTNHS